MNQKTLDFIQICIITKQRDEVYKSIQHKFHSSKNKFVVDAAISDSIQHFFIIINMIVVGFLLIARS